MPLTGDIVNDRLMVLSEMMRRAAAERPKTGREKNDVEQARSDAGGGPEAQGSGVSAHDDSSMLTNGGDKTGEHVFKSESTSWHQE